MKIRNVKQATLMRLKQRQREYFLDALMKAKNRAFDDHYVRGIPFEQITPVIEEVAEVMEPYRYPGDSMEQVFGEAGSTLNKPEHSSHADLVRHVLGHDFDWLSVHHRNEDMKSSE